MSASEWTDDFLDRMRLVGDPPADRAVAALFASRDQAAIQSLLGSLGRNDDVASADLPDEIREYFDALPEIPAPEQIIIVEGQRLFADYGPEILIILACFSLPDCYAAGKGVQVLYQTGFLTDRPNRRLFQTAQMLIDVLSPGGLGPRGRGRRTAQKVRLMHAAIRHLVLHNPGKPWPMELGVPINQEDLAGTLASFTSVILDGLSKLHVDVSYARADAYLTTWQAVARHFGIVKELIPATVEDAHQLAAIIRRRQHSPSDEGRAMTAALVQMLTEFVPPGFRRLPAATMHMFLGREIADGLGVPVAHLEEEILQVGITVGSAIDRLTGGQARRRVFRLFGLAVIQLFLRVELGGHRPEFRIPTELRDSWELSHT